MNRLALTLRIAVLTVSLAATADEIKWTTGVTDNPSPPPLAPGRPAGVYSINDIEAMNVYNGRLSVSIPLLTVGGRGRTGYTIRLLVTPTPWRAETEVVTSPNYSASPVYNWNTSILAQWDRLPVGYGPGYVAVRYAGEAYSGATCRGGASVAPFFKRTMTYVSFAAPDGTEIPLYNAPRSDGQNDYLGTDTITPKASVIEDSCTGSWPDLTRGREYRARDGSGIVFNVADTVTIVDRNDPSLLTNGGDMEYVDGMLRFRDGTTYEIKHGHVTTIRDANGNQTTFCYKEATSFDACDTSDVAGDFQPRWIKDALGRTIRIAYNVVDNDGTADVITYPGFKGVGRTLRIYRAPYVSRLRSDIVNNSQRLFPDVNQETATMDYVPARLVLDNDKSYDFYYNRYGELARLELPAGGAFEYDYAAGVGGSSRLSGQLNAGYYPVQDQSSPSPEHSVAVYRRLSKKRVYASRNTAGGSNTCLTLDPCESVTTFASGEALSQTANGMDEITFTGYVSVATAARDAASTTVQHYFSGYASGSPWSAGQELLLDIGLTRRDSRLLGPAAGLLGTEYKTEFLNGAAAVKTVERQYSENVDSHSPNVTEVKTTLKDAGQTGAVVSRVTTEYDRFDNPAAERTYDYSQAARQVIKKTYQMGDYVKSNRNLLSLPASEIVYEGDETTIRSKTVYTYDGSDLAAMTACSAIVQHDSAFASSSPGLRGNLTKMEQWASAVKSVVSTYSYDEAGNRVGFRDPGLAQTTYTCGPGYYCGYLTKIEKTAEGIVHATSMAYDYPSGKTVEIKDPAGVVTKADYSAPLDRLKMVTKGDTGDTLTGAVTDGENKFQTRYQYDDDNQTVTITGDSVTFGDSGSEASSKQIEKFDGFGRLTGRQAYDSKTLPVVTSTAYDGLGRVRKQYPPCRTSTYACAGSGRTTEYDVLDRAGWIEEADGGRTVYTYANQYVTVTDPAGIVRKFEYDGLGGLSSVTEGGTETTKHFYNAMGKLTSVEQGAQIRTFGYDWLGRLTSATNPENGNVQYDYYDNGTLKKRTAASGKTTDYTHDSLGRPLTRTYSGTGTGAVSYTWDTVRVGSLSSASNNRSSTSFEYWPLGLVKTSIQVTQTSGSAVTAAFGYKYNRAGVLTSITYPSQRVVSYTPDRGGKVREITGLLNGAARGYAGSVEYSDHGAMQSADWGTSLSEVWSFNGRLQPCKIEATRGQTVVSQIELYYRDETAACGAGANVGNNGNVRRQKITPLGTELAYTYDPWNRLYSVEERIGATQVWWQDYAYDRWGNRGVIGGGYTPSGDWTPQVLDRTAGSLAARFPAKNRAVILGGSVECTEANALYDCDGNLIRFGGTYSSSRTLSYDNENRVTQVASGTTALARYDYDGEGRRVRSEQAGVERVYGYDAWGQLMTETVVAGTASDEPDCQPCYLIGDHLGSTRAMTKADGTVLRRTDYLPFGEELLNAAGRSDGNQYGANTPGGNRVLFTGKERDGETGLDYFGARYMSAAQGRFTSPDPLGVMKQKLFDPQQWNMYAYGRNNPLRFGDPSGKRVELIGSEEERRKMLEAIKQGVGDKAASYVTVRKDSGFLGLGKTHYYVEATDNKAFASTNAVAEKIGGLMADTGRTATIRFLDPGTTIQGRSIGSADKGMTPAGTLAIPDTAHVYVTRGNLGSLPAALSETGQRTPATLPEVLIHELGHVDAAWYYGGRDTNGDAVRVENLVRQMEGAPLRVGHNTPYDVLLRGYGLFY